MYDNFAAGVATGASFIKNYEDFRNDRVRQNQIDLEQQQRERFHDDSNEIQKRYLELHAQAQDTNKELIMQQIKNEQFSLEKQRIDQEQHVSQSAKLVDATAKVNAWINKPAGPNMMAELADITNNYGDIFASDRPEIMGMAQALQAQVAKKLQVSGVTQQLLKQDEAWKNGFVQPGAPSGPAKGVQQQEISDIRTQANLAGVSIDDPKYAPLWEAARWKTNGEMQDASKAMFQNAIQQALQERAQAVPDKNSIIEINSGQPNPLTMKYPASAKITLGDLISNPQARAMGDQLMKTLGTNAPTVMGNTPATTNSKPAAPVPDRIQDGVRFMWSPERKQYIPRPGQ